jgi:cytoskeletal protein CcmA (bactofilin family)
MFSGNKDNKGNPPQAKASTNFNYLVEGSVFEGKISSKSDFRIDGVFTGNLQCSSKVVIGLSGKVEGEIYCENAVIEGQFNGKLIVNSLLNVKEKAKIIGEVEVGKLAVQEGAHFHVSCKMKSGNAREESSFGGKKG